MRRVTKCVETERNMKPPSASGFASSNLGLERSDDWAAGSCFEPTVSVLGFLPRLDLAGGPLVVLQVCAFSFDNLCLTCLGWDSRTLLCLLGDFVLEVGESTADVYNSRHRNKVT